MPDDQDLFGLNPVAGGATAATAGRWVPGTVAIRAICVLDEAHRKYLLSIQLRLFVQFGTQIRFCVSKRY